MLELHDAFNNKWADRILSKKTDEDIEKWMCKIVCANQLWSKKLELVSVIIPNDCWKWTKDAGGYWEERTEKWLMCIQKTNLYLQTPQIRCMNNKTKIKLSWMLIIIKKNKVLKA